MLRRLPRDPLLILVVLLAVAAGRWLLAPGYFNMHDDLQMFRQLAMEECFQDLQIPCRWTRHMGYGFGFPLFAYYPPLPYLIGQGIRIFGFSFVTTVKLTFLLSIIVSGVTMYILVKELWGRIAALVSSSFYIWAPYHSLDIFVRGAANEAWALAWFPLILWASYKLISGAQFRYIVILALSWFALFASHNLMVMLFTPLFVVWVLFWLARERSWFTLPQLVISGIWAFGLAAFFTLPVFLEKDLVHVETLVVGYYEYVAHFANIRQLLFSRFWGYGPSAWMDDDKMSFYVGHLHWILPTVLGVFLLLRFAKTRKVDNLLLVTGYFLLAGWFATFMAHLRSIFVWQAIEPLRFVQFPWRFVTLSIFSFSIASGGLIAYLEKEARSLAKPAAVVLVVLVIIFNFQFFRPEKMGPLTDEEKFSGAAYDLQQTAGIYDYLPKGAKTAPKEPRRTVADVVEGRGEISGGELKTNKARFDAKITEDAVVRVNIFQFPGWKIFVDGKQVETFIGDDEWGRMHIHVPTGEYQVTARLYNTPARTAGNTISLVSWVFLLTVPVWRRR